MGWTAVASGLIPVGAAGLVVAWSLRPGVMTVARSFAVGAALVTVVTELLPASTDALGLVALALAAAGFFTPRLLERLRGGDVGVGAALVGVGVHQVVHGVEIAAFESVLGAAGLVALGAHALPIVALSLIGARAAWGQRAALGVWGALLAASAVGIGLGDAVPEPWVEAVEPWIQGLLAGFLLHVVLHVDWSADRRHRAEDLVGLAVGMISVFFLLGGPHEGVDHLTHAHLTFRDALVEITIETAPMLLVGLLAGSAVQASGVGLPEAWLRSGGRLVQAVRGAIIGAPLPVCACGVLPLAQSLSARRAGPALVVAFLLATPELGLETLALSVRFLGWPFALLRLFGALALAIVAGLVVAWAVDRTGELAPVPVSAGEGSFWVRAARAFDELLLHTGPFVLLGLVAAALVEAFTHPEDLVLLSRTGLDVVAVSALAVPSYVCASAATPLAGVMWAKGLSPGAALAGLLLGPATNLATLSFLRSLYGARATVAAMVAVVATAWGLALLANLGLPQAPPLLLPDADDHGHGWVANLTALALGLAAVASLVRHGSGAWIAPIFGGEAVGHVHDLEGGCTDGCGHEQGHDHHHGHDHHGHHHH